MPQKNLFIPEMDFGVTALLKQDEENQKFQIDLHDNNPDRIIEYTKYGTWDQTSGKTMLELHIELLGRAIKVNFKELF